jgi:hypothetical protein
MSDFVHSVMVLSLMLAGGCGGSAPPEEQVSPTGSRLAKLLDDMHVESHWLAGGHVNWRTGEPDGRSVPPVGHHSHCSAFVAAVAAQLGVEILHPPDHPQVLLADAQCAWLADEGLRAGWRPLESPLEAQRDANRGTLVVACYAGSDPELPGHIAVVRPEALSRRRIESEGPQVTQAGIENQRSTSLAEGFRHHPLAWARRAVRFYAHDTSVSGLPEGDPDATPNGAPSDGPPRGVAGGAPGGPSVSGPP